jgi:hypothetical protein
MFAVLVSCVLVAVACTGGASGGGDAGSTSTTASAPTGESVRFDFSYETVPGGNTTEAVIVDGGVELRFGNINFSGSGTLGGEPVEVGVQAHALFRDGTGPSGGSVAVTANDGDVLVLQLDSRATRVGDGARVDGEFTVVGGTGRFAGVSGGGSGTGERNAALGAAVRWSVDLRLDGLDGV